MRAEIKSILLIFLMLLGFEGISQIQKAEGQMTGGIYSGASIETFDNRTQETKSRWYVNEEWNMGSIDLFSSDKTEIRNIPLKFNVVNNQVEIKAKDVVKVIDVKMIREFSYFDDQMARDVTYVNGKLINGVDVDVFEQLYEGDKYSAYRKYTFSILPPDYNPQFDTGSKSERVILEDQMYLYDEEENKLYESKMNHRKLRKTFEDISKEAYKKLKSNKIKIGEYADFIRTMELVNS